MTSTDAQGRLPAAQQAADYAQIVGSALALANDRVLTDIRSFAWRVQLEAPPCPGEWWDVRPMLDPREITPLAVDMATLALQYARQAGLVYQHPVHEHLVCIVAA